MAAQGINPLLGVGTWVDLIQGARYTLSVGGTGGTVLYRLRGFAGTLSNPLLAGETWDVDSELISQVSLDPGSPTATISIQRGWTLRGGQVTGNLGIPVPQTSGGSLGIVITGALPDDSGNSGVVTEPAATAETVLVLGSAAVPGRHYIYVQGACSGPLSTVADILTYIALKGHTSGIYYAVFYAGLGGSLSPIQQVNTAEKLDIVVRNQDTVAHAYWLNWWSNGSA